MPIDKYQPCPCGSGKKIKFCCSADLIGELEKIQRMLDGDQRRACLEHVVHLLEKHPGRPSLLSIKARLESELGDIEHAEQTVKTFLETTPQNPVALAEKTRLLAREQKSVEAVEALQDALDASPDTISIRIYEALGDVAIALLHDGKLPAARAHLRLHAEISGDQEPTSGRLLMELCAAADLPLLLRQDTRFVPCEPDAPYREAFDAAMRLVGRVRWRAALGQLEQLAEKHGREAPIHRNIAILRSYLAREEASARAWRKYSALVAETSPDDAIEAEALAQKLEPTDEADKVDVLETTYEVSDVSQLMEVVLKHPRMRQLRVDTASLVEEGIPPPKAAFLLLDRDMPESAEGLTVESVPRTLCEFFVYGRETDRPPRLEFAISEPVLPQAKQIVEDACGELLKTPPEQTRIGESVAILAQLSWSWQWPKGTTPEMFNELNRQKRRQVILEEWPTVPQSVFDGKSPQQVQHDPKYRVRVLAAILNLELLMQQQHWPIDFNELRSRLGLPPAETIDPASVELDRLPLVRYARLDAAKLETPQLIQLMEHAVVMNVPAAIRNLCKELLRRDIDESQLRLDKAELYGILSGVAFDNQEAISLIDKAREYASAHGHSQARWLLSELPRQIAERRADRMRQIIEILTAKYSREPGVMQTLVDLLAQFGLISPDGSLQAGEAAASVAHEPPSEGLWTPEGPRAAPGGTAAGEPAAEPSKSGLWLPGMD